MKMKLMRLAILLVTFYLHNVTAADTNQQIYESRRHHNTDFDVLIYTQQWPITECYKWEEGNSQNICNLPNPQQSWTIHGIWPTKLGTLGPNFCDNSAHFNLTQLDPIRAELEQFWPSVEKNHPVDSLWNHEWLKHGTCAALAIPELNNELNYFKKGLDWLTQYGLNNVLGQAGIVPGTNYSLQQIHNVLSDHFHTNIAIECFHDRHTGQQFIIEIRSCFDKTLELVNCDGIRSTFDYHSHENIITNCAPSKPIVYPRSVPPLQRFGGQDIEYLPIDLHRDLMKQRKKSKQRRSMKLMVNVYKLIQLLKWATF